MYFWETIGRYMSASCISPPGQGHINVFWKIFEGIVNHIRTAANEGNFTLHIGDDHFQIELRPFLLQFKECLVHVFLEVLVYPR